MPRALRRDDADLGQMPAQRVERRRPLAGEQLASPMAHQLGLVLAEYASPPTRSLAILQRAFAGDCFCLETDPPDDGFFGMSKGGRTRTARRIARLHPGIC